MIHPKVGRARPELCDEKIRYPHIVRAENSKNGMTFLTVNRINYVGMFNEYQLITIYST
jgi:hypothetical protein